MFYTAKDWIIEDYVQKTQSLLFKMALCVYVIITNSKKCIQRKI